MDLRLFHPEVRSTGDFSLVISLGLRAGEPWQDGYQRLPTALTGPRGRSERVDALLGHRRDALSGAAGPARRWRAARSLGRALGAARAGAGGWRARAGEPGG